MFHSLNNPRIVGNLSHSLRLILEEGDHELLLPSLRASPLELHFQRQKDEDPVGEHSRRRDLSMQGRMYKSVEQIENSLERPERSVSKREGWRVSGVRP